MQICIDIETLDIKPSAVILSVAVVPFSTKSREIFMDKAFFMKLDPNKQYNRSTSPSTIAFWSKQKQEVKDMTFGGTTRPHEFLAKFSEYLRSLGGVNKLKVWSRGSFDKNILGDMYQRNSNLTCPWSYWNEMDVRVLDYLVSRKGGKRLPSTEMLHSALHDAEHEAKQIIEYHKFLGL